MQDSQRDKIIKRLDRLCMESDTRPIVGIQGFQKAHLASMGKEFGGFMNQFEMYFSNMVQVSDTLNYLDKKTWPINRGFQFVITTRSLKQLYSAYVLFYNGFYEDSIAILRSAYESFIRVIFISCHPTNPYNAFRVNGQSGPSFNATGFVNDELKLDWVKYKIMNFFAHSNQYQVMEDIIEIAAKRKIKKVTLTYEKDETMIGIVTTYFQFIETVYLRLYNEVFRVEYPANHKNINQLQILFQKLNEYADISFLVLKTHPKEYWAKVCKDLDNLFELILYMDDYPKANWKNEWPKIIRSER